MFHIFHPRILRLRDVESRTLPVDEVKKPKFDLTKLMELHSDSLKGDVGARP